MYWLHRTACIIYRLGEFGGRGFNDLSFTFTRFIVRGRHNPELPLPLQDFYVLLDDLRFNRSKCGVIHRVHSNVKYKTQNVERESNILTEIQFYDGLNGRSCKRTSTGTCISMRHGKKLPLFAPYSRLRFGSCVLR